jgi:hypothetical protein
VEDNVNQAQQTAQPQLRWEHRDVTIPVNIQGKAPSHYDVARELGERVNPIILATVHQLAGEGWQAEGPTEFRSLWERFQVTSRSTGGIISAAKWHIDSVSMRFKRPVP